MKRIHIVGRKNSGKTALIVDLVQEFTRRGMRVGTIKHTHHQHELDTPGKDSHRHKEAGAAVVGVLSQSMNAAFWSPPETADHEVDSRYDSFPPMFAECDFVIVEGDSQTKGCKIEVWREALDSPPLVECDQSIAAVVSDDKLDIGAPVWSRSTISELASKVLSLLHERVLE